VEAVELVLCLLDRSLSLLEVPLRLRQASPRLPLSPRARISAVARVLGF
jgi:hypothetical protein